MTPSVVRLVLVGAATAVCVVALGAPGCSSTTKKVVPYDGSAGEAGASGTAGSTADAGSAGTPSSAGESGGLGDAGAGNASGSASGGTGGGAGSAGSGGSAASGGSGGQIIQIPDIDAGVGCTPPTDDSQLSAAAAGLPTTGLALWLRADHGVYLTSDQRVCAWVDQSGHQRVFTPAGSGRALWVDASVGTRAALQFDASAGPLTVGGVLDLPATSARTLIAVVKLTELTARFQPLMQGQAASRGTYVNLDANTYGTVGSREGVYVQNNAYDSALSTSTDTRLHVYAVGTMTPGTVAFGALTYRVNGVTQTLTRNANFGTGNGNFEDFSGANFTLVGNGTTGFIAEALIYDHVLAAGELSAVESALEARYGIVPPQN